MAGATCAGVRSPVRELLKQRFWAPVRRASVPEAVPAPPCAQTTSKLLEPKLPDAAFSVEFLLLSLSIG
ncbi:hypothetical protein NDU88_003268 [Pleurodeles waltl]|uniref:Uncharacterized protein n=1 Tax=Pleurodeles waltl TaxID=8319 RepID=A0AAV7QB99_PLEWA|nr:hypothetical protein NDU88_003268 [Pleurodeles waltl]